MMHVTLKLYPTEGGANTRPLEPNDDPMYPTKGKNRERTQAPTMCGPQGTHIPVNKDRRYPKTSNVGSKY